MLWIELHSDIKGAKYTDDTVYISCILFWLKNRFWNYEYEGYVVKVGLRFEGFQNLLASNIK